MAYIDKHRNNLKLIKKRLDDEPKKKKKDAHSDSIHNMTGLLKHLLRERERLISDSLIDAFGVLLKKHPDRVDVETALFKLMETEMPEAGKQLVDALVVHLKKVVAEPTNCMDVSNIAKVFAPTLCPEFR